MKDPFYASVPISSAIVSPSSELGRFNGFAWTDEVGIIVQAGIENSSVLDLLQNLRNDDINQRTYDFIALIQQTQA